MKGYKKGIISEDLNSVGGSGHKKGDVVYYKRYKTRPDRDGFKLTDYEWHYLNENKTNLVRSSRLMIEGIEKFQEPYLPIKGIGF